jgi:hypothetical protein
MVATFWENFFLFLIFLPMAMLWGFALVDLFRRDDIGGMAKSLWVTCVILLPFLGTLVYLVARPTGATAEERLRLDEASRVFEGAPSNNMSELSTLADLHDRGKLTDDEFAAEKARVLGAGSAVPA